MPENTLTLVPEPPTTETFRSVPVVTSEEIRDIRRRLAIKRQRSKGLSWRPAFFRCPWPCTRSQYEHIRNDAVNKWIDAMQKQGWDLKSKVYVNVEGRTVAYDYSGDWLSIALLDQVQIPCGAWFKVRKNSSYRIEIPVKEPGAAEETARLDLVKGGSN